MATDQAPPTANENNGAELVPQRPNQTMRREFDGVTLAHENPATQALIAKSTADTQARWVMAMKRPRIDDEVRQNLIYECRRPQLAKVAIYAVPRGGKTITGLSIRFAEVAMRTMTNMACEAMTLYDSDQERMVRVSVSDFETNVSWSRDITIKKTKEVKQLGRNQRAIRSRANSFGDIIYIVDATDDDVRMKEASEISKAARTGILRLVPGNLLDECRRICEEVAANAAAQDPDGERNRLFDAFAKLDVTPSDIAEFLGHPADKIVPSELVELRLLYNGLSGGDIASWREALEHADKIREKAKAMPVAKPPDPGAKTAAETPSAKAEEKKSEPSKSTSGKGTSAAKDKLKESRAAAGDAKPETKPSEPPAAATAPAKAPVKDGHEERLCNDCGQVIEVPKGTPDGALCYACAQA